MKQLQSESMRNPLPKIKLVISDLHLADSHSIFEGFGDLQQSALEGLLSAASTNGFADNADDVELIINGDCFEFLFMEPHDEQGITYPSTALSKLERVINGHRSFFNTLEHFISQTGRHVTFITGNHDVELVFKDVQERISEVICTEQGLKERVNFCQSYFYRPSTDVHIEHGNQYDFWNRITDLWDENGQPLTSNPDNITLPLGTQYVQRASYPINVQYPYFDHFEPAMNLTPQIAILCLMNPEIVITTVQHAMEMLSNSRKPFAVLTPEEQNNPVLIFELAMRELAAFQEDLVAQYPNFIEPLGESSRVDAMLEFVAIREALSLPFVDAMKTIFVPTIYRMEESTAQGIQNSIKREHSVRYAIAGHTHMHRINSINHGSQVYLNTGTWTTRYALPNPGEITPELIAWLSKPNWNPIPLRDVTQIVFALIRTEEESPSSVNLCVWQGGEKGTYHVLT
jgi:UDP-2,3-diacylglucosamine pyrophosphatase LpxH